MNIAINNGTFLNPGNNATVVVLTKISDNVNFLVCASTSFNRTSDMGLVCTYIMTALITTKPQQWDPLTPTEFEHAVSQGLINQNEFTIYHMPPYSRDTKATYSASHLLRATTDATLYLASLGHNVLVNQQAEQLYVLYDTVLLKDVFEVPLPLVIFLLVMIVVCLLAWALSERLYTSVFNGSLYKVIHQEVQEKGGKTAMLMDCTHGPLAFEGYQVIPDFDENFAQSSQESLVEDLDNRSSEPTLLMSPVQLQNQEPPVLQSMVAQSPFLVPMSPDAHSPTSTLTSSPTPTGPTVSLAAPFFHAKSSSLSVQTLGQFNPPPIPTRPPMSDGMFSRTSTNSGHHTPRSISGHISERSTSSPPPPRSTPPSQSVTLIESPIVDEPASLPAPFLFSRMRLKCKIYSSFCWVSFFIGLSFLRGL